MALLFDATILELLLGFALLLCVYYIYTISNYSYWKDRSIAYKKPSFPFGSDKDLLFFKQSVRSYFEGVYNKFNNEKVVGMFELREPYLLVRDTALIRLILTKDFQHFIDRGLEDPDLWHPANRHLFFMNGEPWKVMRQKLTPAFTSGKLKMMYFLIETCCNEFVEALDLLARKNEKFVVKDFVDCFTTDVIASCGFGLQSNSIKDPENEIRQNGKKLMTAPPMLTLMKHRFAKCYPEMFKKLGMELVTGTENFFMELVENTITYREKHGIIRNDFIDILIKLKNNKSLLEEEINRNRNLVEDGTNNESVLTREEMAAQALLFFSAGFETTSSAISFCFYEIALNPDVQAKMRKEADEVFNKNSGNPNYLALQDMTYIEAVLNETLRRYSNLSILNRTCTKAYKVPDMNLVIPRGMKVVIPTYAIQHDPKHYPDPYKFDPERFTDNKIATKNNYKFLPFGEGPRMCIGNRFAIIQMKLCLSLIVHNFELSVTEATQIPVTISKKHFGTTADPPIVLKISRRTS